MTNQEIESAAVKYCVENNKKWPHLTIPEFTAGARWAAGKIEKELVELTTMLDQIINASTDDQLDKAISNAQKRLKL